METFKVWQCVGCGRIDHPQPCVGICQDRPVELVYAAELAAANQRIEALEAVARKIALVTPRAGDIERTWIALQAEARKALGP